MPQTLLLPHRHPWAPAQASVSSDADILAAVNVDTYPDGEGVTLEAIFGNSITYSDDGEVVAAAAMTQARRCSVGTSGVLGGACRTRLVGRGERGTWEWVLPRRGDDQPPSRVVERSRGSAGLGLERRVLTARQARPDARGCLAPGFGACCRRVSSRPAPLMTEASPPSPTRSCPP